MRRLSLGLPSPLFFSYAGDETTNDTFFPSRDIVLLPHLGFSVGFDDATWHSDGFILYSFFFLLFQLLLTGDQDFRNCMILQRPMWDRPSQLIIISGAFSHFHSSIPRFLKVALHSRSRDLDLIIIAGLSCFCHAKKALLCCNIPSCI